MRALILLPVLFLSITVAAQETPEPHRLPFASEGNTLELAVANTSNEAALESVTVHVETIPEWLVFASNGTGSHRIRRGSHGGFSV